MKINWKIWIIIFFELVASLSSFLLLKFGTFVFSCQLSILQNIVFPFFATPFLMHKVKNWLGLNFRLSGTLVGAALGFIPATSGIMVNIIKDYVINREGLSETIDVFLVGIAAYLSLWIFTIVVSAIIGFLSSCFFGEHYQE